MHLIKSGRKRAWAALCALCAALTLFSGMPVVRAAEDGAVLSASEYEAARGQKVSVAVDLSGNPGIWGIKFKVGYNAEALRLASVFNGSVFTDEETVLKKESGEDPYVYIACSDLLKNRETNGTIVTLDFVVADGAAQKAYPITIEVVQAIDVSGTDVPIGTKDGAVTVTGSGTGGGGGTGSGGSGTGTEEPCSHDLIWVTTKEATCISAGTETETCTLCGETFGTRESKATGHLHTKIKNAVSAKYAAKGYTGDTYCTDCGKRIAKGKTLTALKYTSRQLNLRVPGRTKSTNVLKWKAVKGADGYVIYGAARGKKLVKQAVIKNGKKTTWTDKNLKSGTFYRYYIKAYIKVNGKTLWSAQSKTISATTAGGKYGNVKSISVNRTSVSLKKGKTFALKAKQVSTGRQLEKRATLRYETTNSKIATVSSKGKIKAKKAGTCYVYVFAQNGVYKCIKVKVRK